MTVIDGGFAKPTTPDLHGRFPAKDAMIVWEPATAETPDALGRRKSAWQKPTKPEVRVFDDVGDHGAHDRYGHLPCSLGCCLHGWCDQDALADVFRTFLAVVSDGVPVADVHREFLKIDEYYRMLDRREFFGVPMPETEEA